jgi:hypothetical protein
VRWPHGISGCRAWSTTTYDGARWGEAFATVAANNYALRMLERNCDHDRTTLICALDQRAAFTKSLQRFRRWVAIGVFRANRNNSDSRI